MYKNPLSKRQSSANRKSSSRRKAKRSRRLRMESLEPKVVLSGESVVFIDPTVWDQDSIPVELANAADEVVVLDAASDGVQQMADYLAGRTEIGAIHILSHGEVGELSPIGNSQLNSDNIASYSTQLATIGNAISDDGDILLWGCAVAGPEGVGFVQSLANATGADVAASTDLTGSPTLGGDWDLEYTTGTIEATNILEAADPQITLSHFRGGGLSWESLSGTEIEFNLEQTWRRSAFGVTAIGQTANTGRLYYGDGQNSNIIVTVQSINLALDSFTGTATINHTYSSPATRTAYFESCCRIGGLRNNSNGSFRMETIVTPGTANDPPLTSVPAIVSVSDNHIVQFPIPAFDPNGDSISFRLANSTEAGNGFTQPPGMSIDSTTGVVTWDIRDSQLSTTPGQLWSAQVMVTDSHGAKVPADFMLKVTSATNSAPVFDSIPATLTAIAGAPLTFSVQASDPDSAVPVTLQALTPPAGMTFTSQTPVGSPNPDSDTRVQGSWAVPTAAAGTSFVLNFVATDNLGVATFQGINVTVTNQPPVANNDGAYPGTEDTNLSVIASNGVLVNDNDPDVGNTNDADADGTPDYLDADPNNAGNSTNIGLNGMIAIVNTGPTNGALTLNKDGSFTYVPNPDFNGVDSFTYVANDGFGNSSPATVTINVTSVNDAPIANAGGFPTPYAILEGASLVLDGSSSTDDTSIDNYEWDLDYDGVTFNADLSTTSSTLSHTFNDDFSGTMALRVTDGDGLTDIATTSLTVTNVAPELTGDSITSPINEGETATFAGTIVDPGADTFTLILNWGDTTADQTYVFGTSPINSGGVTWNPATSTFAIDHQYFDDGSSPGNNTPSDTYTVTIVSLTDDDGGAAGIVQGGSIFLTGHDILEHSPYAQQHYDDVVLDYLRGQGTPLEISRGDYDIGLYSHSYFTPGVTPNGASFGSVSVATSANLASDTAFRSYLSTIDVLVVPEFSNTVSLATYSSAISDFFNAGGDLFIDSSNGSAGYYNFLPSVIGADGPGINTSSGFSPTAAGTMIGITSVMVNGFPTHNRFINPDPVFTVLETHSLGIVSIGAQNVVLSESGISDPRSVTVNNVAPTFNPTGAGPDELLPSSADGIFSRTGITFNDPGVLDVHNVTVNFGDGTGNQSFTISPTGNRSFDLPSHTYETEGIFQVSVTVADDDNNGGLGEVTDTFSITVDLNDPPVAVDDILGEVTFSEDDAAANITPILLNNDSDPDGDPINVISIVDSTTLGTLSFSGGQVSYNPNGDFESLAQGDTATQSFSYTISDDSGETDTANVIIRINGTNDAPTVAVNDGTISVPEGSTASNHGVFSDIDLGDNVTITASFGTVSQVGTQSGTWNWSYGTIDDQITPVIITATDEDGGSSSVSFGLTVNNVAPTANDVTVDLVENSSDDTEVTVVTATDPGTADIITYSITGGTGTAAFKIDTSSGVITVKDSTLLDYESDPFFTLVVRAEDDDGGIDTANVTVNLLNQASIWGVVYVDVDEDNSYEGNEQGIDGAVIELRDANGISVKDEHGDAIQAITSDGGTFLFEDLDPAVYQIFQYQPTGVTDGAEDLGSLGGTVVANDTMQLTLERVDAIDYAFAEIGGQVTTGEGATIGFWHNKNGQQLIATGGNDLGKWLTTNFSNVFGNSLAGANGNGASGEAVADFFRDQLFMQKSKKSRGPAKVDAQFMATALNVYFTNENLGGAAGASYGLTVSDTGLGVRVVDVENRGDAFGVADGTSLTVMQLLLATDLLTDEPDNLTEFASIYDTNGDGIIDAEEARLRALANEMYSWINEQ